MPRISRVVMPGIPHHVTQRGNRRLPTFFCEEDYKQYIRIMSKLCRECGVEIWGYCLMPNHTHLIGVPETKDSLSAAIGEAHRRYTWMVNKREGWKGYLWQGRFASFPMDEAHLYLAARYVELNPVRAGMVKNAWDYRWSSAAAHIAGTDDELVRVTPLLKMFGKWDKYLSEGMSQEETDIFTSHIKTGQPLGDEVFLSDVKKDFGLDFGPRKRGPKGPWKNKGKK